MSLHADAGVSASSMGAPLSETVRSEDALRDQVPPEGAWLGTVVAIQANYYSVQLDEVTALAEFVGSRTGDLTEQPVILLCIRRGLLKKLGQQIMVGDRVTVEEPDWQGMRGAVASVRPRQTFLDRPPIANVDQILLVFALAEPLLDPNQLSRFLVKAESTGMAI
ncbi:MAG: GTPase RsgA, partial [Cyanobacteria bacterium J06598_3]